ncbi:12071_t:CDS:2, partial [Dentiscutata heterogama]
MKHAIESTGSLIKAFSSLDRWLRLYYEENLLQCENKSICIDSLLAQDDKERLEPLLRRVSQFALNKIKNELLSATVYEACLCELRVNYDIPCHHMLPTKGSIMLSSISKRWLLFPNQDQPNSSHIIQNITSQKTAFLDKLDDVLAVLEIKLSDIKIPEKIIEKDYPSGTKRLPTALEHQSSKILLSYCIPADDIDQIHNLLNDAINNQLNKRMEIYKDWLGYNTNLLKQILEFQASPCHSLFWFISSNCAQLAANTFSVPIAIFDDKNEQSMLFFSLETPP